MKEWPTRIRAKRACPGCGYERMVKVFQIGGVDEFEPPKCGMCAAMDRAIYHEQAAKKFWRKYGELRARRERRKR